MIVKFKFLKDLGKKKKGDVVEMHVTTARALADKKIGSFDEPKEVKAEKPKGKAEAIGTKSGK